MNKRILSVVLVAVLAVALVLGAVVVSAADGITTTDQLTRAQEKGGNYKLGANVGPDASGDLKTSTLEVEAGKSLTLDLNGYTIKGVTITVKAGATLTIKDSDSNKAGLITDSAIEVVAGADKDHKTVLNVESGEIVESPITTAANTVVNVKGGEITVEDGTAITASAGAEVNVSNGTIDNEVLVEGGSTLNISGGTITNVMVENGKATMSAGDIKEDLVVREGKETRLSGGTVHGNVYIDDNGDVYITGTATVGNVLGYNGAVDGDVDIRGGYIWGKVDIDDSDVTGGYFRENPASLVDPDYVSVVLYNNWKMNAKNDGVEVASWYVVGDTLIAKEAKAAESVWFKDVLYKDNFVVILDTQGLTLNVPNSDIYFDYVNKDIAKKTTINGELLGTELQMGGRVSDTGVSVSKAVYEDRETSKAYDIDGQPVHLWGEVVKATEYKCHDENGNDVANVLVDYHPDTLNGGYWVTYNAKNEKVVNADIAVTLKGMNGAVITGADGKTAVMFSANGSEQRYNAATRTWYTIYPNPVLVGGHPYGALKAVPFKAATATEAGNYQYWYCQICGAKLATFVNSGYVNPYATVGALGNLYAVEFDPTIPAYGTGAQAPSTEEPGTQAPSTEEPTGGDEGQSTKPPKTGDVSMNALVWVAILGVSAIGAVVTGSSVVASKKH